MILTIIRDCIRIIVRNSIDKQRVSLMVISAGIKSPTHHQTIFSSSSSCAAIVRNYQVDVLKPVLSILVDPIYNSRILRLWGHVDGCSSKKKKGLSVLQSPGNMQESPTMMMIMMMKMMVVFVYWSKRV